MADNLRLVIMAFPQRWDPAAKTIAVNAVLIPTVSPIDDPLLGGSSPTFADHVPDLRAVLIGNLAGGPLSSDPGAARIKPIIVQPQPLARTRPNYKKLLAQATALSTSISGSGALTTASHSKIRKALPRSYLDVTGARPNGDTTTTTDDFGCAIRGQTPVRPGPTVRNIGWGPMISYALRQKLLATALGLRYEMQVHLQNPDTFSHGGWLFLELAQGDLWAKAATAGQIRLYAARLPTLAKSRRQVFASIIFPVDAVGIADSAFSVAETYDDGFAQVVHVHQPQANSAVIGDGLLPAGSDIGIQIGWDDEQVVAWHNGQIQILNERLSGNLKAQTPLGVAGYRVDVADVTLNPAVPTWHSLVRATSVLPRQFGRFDGELTIEPTALRPQDPSAPGADAWLPRYFANWRGGSLVVADDVAKAMLDKRAIKAKRDPVGVLLSYGRTYAFRVRLADLSSGGPEVGENPVNLDPADVATLVFRRAVPPKQPGVEPSQSIQAGTKIVGTLIFSRPLIGYPEVLYTSLGRIDADRRQIVEFFTKTANPGSGLVVGLPDPDVHMIELIVEVRTPAHDVAGDGVLDAPFRKLYRTTRLFPSLPAGALPVDPRLPINLAFVDAPSIVDWATDQPATGPLFIPRARDVRITARALTRDDPRYFSPVAITGHPTSLTLRAEARSEPSLLIRPIDGSPPLRGFLFNRPLGIDAPPVATQFAQQLGVVVDGLSLSAPPGKRIAFGASKGVRHTLSGDNSTITFSSESELLRQWIVAIVIDLERDWTWDGLGNVNTVTVERDGVAVGSLTVVRTLGSAAVADPANWDRNRTRLVFFDGIDPHEKTPSGFPEAIEHAWRMSASINKSGFPVGAVGTPMLQPGAVPPPTGPDLNAVSQALRLPIATPPSQIPEIASVGLAFSPFTAGPGYASTAARKRALWIELRAPIQNKRRDTLFARVLAHGSDPLLYNADPSLYDTPPNTDVPPLPPLVLDPELMRVITPGESDNRAGLDAMTTLEAATDSAVHFLLPLPPGMEPSDPDLFGFYTYELRIGHAGKPDDNLSWSTAQARFGRPLRVNGVQHPAPELVCRAGRLRRPIKSKINRRSTLIRATATYATPTLNGQPLATRQDFPKTAIFFFLYAQVVQADAVSNRNVLLFQREGRWERRVDARDGGISGIPRSGPSSNLSSQRDRVSLAFFSEGEIENQLEQLGLSVDLPLSVVAVEFLPGGVGGDLPNTNRKPGENVRSESNIAAVTRGVSVDKNPDPLDLNGRPRRILRVSSLVPVAPIC